MNLAVEGLMKIFDDTDMNSKKLQLPIDNLQCFSNYALSSQQGHISKTSCSLTDFACHQGHSRQRKQEHKIFQMIAYEYD